jgi:3-oxocholest-4-en-26-oyl-CoA dehydrogenase beta subunit
MDITLSASEQQVRDGVRQLLTSEVTTDFVQSVEDTRQFPAELWQLLGRDGWLGVGVSDGPDGAGGSLVDWALVLEESGRVACPAPVVEHLAAVAYLASALPQTDPRLTEAAAGRLVVTLAHLDKPGAPVTADMSAGGTAGHANLTGVKVLVPYAEGASHIVVVANSDCGRSYFWLDASSPGVSLTPIDSVSRNQHCLLLLDAAPAELLGTGAQDPAADLIELYTLASDAFAVGLMGRMIDMSLTYVQQRVQFGQPIGQFQAVQHRCADMAVAHSGAQSLLYKAAWLLSTGKPAEETLLMCHAYGRDAAAVVLGNAHQVHGAMGFMMEYPLHQFSRRAKVYEQTLGQASLHRERFAQLEGQKLAQRAAGTAVPEQARGPAQALVPH